MGNVPESLKGLFQVDVEYADDPESNTQDFVDYNRLPESYKALIPIHSMYPDDNIKIQVTIGLERTTIERLS